MSMYRIGVDPGVSGAWVILAGGHPIEWGRMPVLQEGKAKRVDCAQLARMLQDFDDGEAFVELVHSMPKQGVASSFSFGHAAGSVMGILAALCIPVTMVSPQAWKKRAGLLGADKDAARSRAIQLWPDWKDLGTKGEGQALADAALIALHGRP